MKITRSFNFDRLGTCRDGKVSDVARRFHAVNNALHVVATNMTVFWADAQCHFATHVGWAERRNPGGGECTLLRSAIYQFPRRAPNKSRNKDIGRIRIDLIRGPNLLYGAPVHHHDAGQPA